MIVKTVKYSTDRSLLFIEATECPLLGKDFTLKIPTYGMTRGLDELLRKAILSVKIYNGKNKCIIRMFRANPLLDFEMEATVLEEG